MNIEMKRQSETFVEKKMWQSKLFIRNLIQYFSIVTYRLVQSFTKWGRQLSMNQWDALKNLSMFEWRWVKTESLQQVEAAHYRNKNGQFFKSQSYNIRAKIIDEKFIMKFKSSVHSVLKIRHFDDTNCLNEAKKLKLNIKAWPLFEEDLIGFQEVFEYLFSFFSLLWMNENFNEKRSKIDSCNRIK